MISGGMCLQKKINVSSLSTLDKIVYGQWTIGQQNRTYAIINYLNQHHRDPRGDIAKHMCLTKHRICHRTVLSLVHLKYPTNEGTVLLKKTFFFLTPALG